MQQAKKFLFEANFENPLNDLREEPVRAFTEEDLAAAQKKGFDEGKSEGRKEAEAETDRQAVNALEQISKHLASLNAAQSEASKSNAREASELAMTVARKVIPEISKHGALVEIEAMVRQCLADRFEEPRVVIRVHDSLLDNLRTRIDAVAENAGFPGKLILLADEALHDADCRVEWADGGAERDEERIWKDIEESARRLIGQFEKDGSFRAPTAKKPEAAATEAAPPPAAEKTADGATTETVEAPAAAAPENPEETAPDETPDKITETKDSAEIQAESPGENDER
ncbi:MAG: hypothetical protein J4G10_07650 [Alphaproteobacteria bacterium]|nr:hypothetical protein [Alphaproteobacteria bacterium]